jgi:hypothetical protein
MGAGTGAAAAAAAGGAPLGMGIGSAIDRIGSAITTGSDVAIADIGGAADDGGGAPDAMCAAELTSSSRRFNRCAPGCSTLGLVGRHNASDQIDSEEERKSEKGRQDIRL